MGNGCLIMSYALLEARKGEHPLIPQSLLPIFRTIHFAGMKPHVTALDAVCD
jgi:hypothetical protein